MPKLAFTALWLCDAVAEPTYPPAHTPMLALCNARAFNRLRPAALHRPQVINGYAHLHDRYLSVANPWAALRSVLGLWAFSALASTVSAWTLTLLTILAAFTLPAAYHRQRRLVDAQVRPLRLRPYVRMACGYMRVVAPDDAWISCLGHLSYTTSTRVMHSPYVS